MVMTVGDSTLVGCVVGLDLWGTYETDEDESQAPMFRYTDRRDVGLLINK